MLDQNAIVSVYTNDKTQTIKTVADTFGAKPADIAAVLRLNGVTIRRGAPGGISEEARAKARATQKSKAFYRILNKLLDEHEHEDIVDALSAVAEAREVEISLENEINGTNEV